MRRHSHNLRCVSPFRMQGCRAEYAWMLRAMCGKEASLKSAACLQPLSVPRAGVDSAKGTGRLVDVHACGL